MQPGGPRQAILVATALAASAVLAAWWWSAPRHGPRGDRVSSSNLPRPAFAAAPARIRDDVAPTGVASLPAEAPAPASAPAPAAPAPAQEPPPPAPAPDAAADAPPAPTQNANDETPDDTQHEPAATSGDSSVTDANATQPDDEADTGESDAPPAGSAVDPDKAADLMANYLADLDAPDHADSEDAKAQRYFDSRDAGGERERQIEDALRKGIADWIAALPPEDAARLLLLGVECRVEQCRILIAQEHYGVEAGATEAEQDRQIKLLTQFNALSAEPWWQALGLHMGHSVSFPAPDGSGIGLWVHYEFVTPVEQAPSDGSAPDA